MQASILGIGLLAPGLSGWPDGRAVLSGRWAYQPGDYPEPRTELLPPNERRRSSECVRWAIHVAQEAIIQSGLDARNVATVFASSGGEMDVFDKLCRTLATAERIVSPTLFHQSVHNTAAGYWGIATTCQQASTALSCYDDSFAAGLIEAVSFASVEVRPVLLVAYDLPAPAPLRDARQIALPFAAALVLSPVCRPALATVTFRVEPANGHADSQMFNDDLERLRLDNPAARALPILAALAREVQQTLSLNFLDDQRIVVELEPCRD